MKKHTIMRTVFLLALLTGATTQVFADINDVNVDDTFAYGTRKTINVDIQINTPTGDATGLSFYSTGVDGLRLLDTRIVAGSGHYVGKLILPAYIKAVVVKSRWLDDFQEVKLNITAAQITAVIDHF